MPESLFSSRLKNQFPSLSEEAGGALVVPAADIKSVCIELKSAGFDELMNLAAVDYQDKFAVVYHFFSFASKEKITLKVFLDKTAPQVESVASLWRAADWHEREAFDLMGIVFKGHPDLRRILLPEEWSGHPLRKDFQREGFVKMPSV